MLGHIFPAKCNSDKRLDGKTVVITGCNTGIGKINAREFYKRGARVVMACRDTAKAEQARQEILKEVEEGGDQGRLILKKLDLCSLESVRACAREILSEENHIDVLVNNAGIMMCPLSFTEDKIEKQFATNHVGHFLFTLMLLPRIIAAAPSKIINLSSSIHKWSDTDLEDYNFEKTRYTPRVAYARSKLANVLFTKELARRLKGRGVNTYAVHPGVVRTELGRHLDESYFRGAGAIASAFKWLLLSPEQGAQTTMFCALDDSAANESGLYYSNCKSAPSNPAAEDEALAKKLWKISLDLVNLTDSDPLKETGST